MKFLHFNLILPKNATLKQRKKYQSRTVAVEEPTMADIQRLTSTFQKTSSSTTLSANVNVGVTFLSLKDRYSKKEGRREAIAKMQSVPLDVESILVTKSHIFVNLAVHKGVALSLRLNKGSGFATVVGSLSLED